MENEKLIKLETKLESLLNMENDIKEIKDILYSYKFQKVLNENVDEQEDVVKIMKMKYGKEKNTGFFLLPKIFGWFGYRLEMLNETKIFTINKILGLLVIGIIKMISIIITLCLISNLSFAQNLIRILTK